MSSFLKKFQSGENDLTSLPMELGRFRLLHGLSEGGLKRLNVGELIVII